MKLNQPIILGAIALTSLSFATGSALANSCHRMDSSRERLTQGYCVPSECYDKHSYDSKHMKHSSSNYWNSSTNKYDKKNYNNDHTNYNNNSAANADNTARNKRDRYDNSLTSGDQSNRQADIDTTAHIRREIIANKEMSVNAQNVKIITKNGHVTLRGPVENMEEKRFIGEIASRSVNPNSVHNLLEVKK